MTQSDTHFDITSKVGKYWLGLYNIRGHTAQKRRKSRSCCKYKLPMRPINIIRCRTEHQKGGNINVKIAWNHSGRRGDSLKLREI